MLTNSFIKDVSLFVQWSQNTLQLKNIESIDFNCLAYTVCVELCKNKILQYSKIDHKNLIRATPSVTEKVSKLILLSLYKACLCLATKLISC